MSIDTWIQSFLFPSFLFLCLDLLLALYARTATKADPTPTNIHPSTLIPPAEFSFTASVVEFSPSNPLLPCPTTLTPELAGVDTEAEGRFPCNDKVADASGRTTPEGVMNESELLGLEVGAAAGLKTMSDEYDLCISFVILSNK